MKALGFGGLWPVPAGFRFQPRLYMEGISWRCHITSIRIVRTQKVVYLSNNGPARTVRPSVPEYLETTCSELSSKRSGLFISTSTVFSVALCTRVAVRRSARWVRLATISWYSAHNNSHPSSHMSTGPQPRAEASPLHIDED
jgi:hypothetical protein